MTMKKDVQIKARCTNDEKETISAFAKEKGISVSTLLLSCVNAYISLDSQNKGPVDEKNYAILVEKHMVLNHVTNILNLDSSVPETAKEKIQKINL